MSDQNHPAKDARSAEYYAPLHLADLPADLLIPSRYVVYLSPTHSLDEHSRFVGTDMTRYIEMIWDQLFPDKVVYVADRVSDDLLDKIRRDRGVEQVECDGRPTVEDDLTEQPIHDET
jgi:hypothetical protein